MRDKVARRLIGDKTPNQVPRWKHATGEGRRSASGERRCKLCSQTKPAESFTGGAWQCRACLNARNHARYHERYAVSEEFKATRKIKSRGYYKANKEQHNQRVRARNQYLRDLVFEVYGRSCACCGESMREFLTVDHINNDGNRHRAEIGGTAIARWLVKNNFPPGFQILCFNCNIAKHVYGGRCPHQAAEEKCAS
jgi:hypothetical protein